MKKIALLFLLLSVFALAPAAFAAPFEAPGAGPAVEVPTPAVVINGHTLPAVRGDTGTPVLVMVGDTAYIDLLDLGNLHGVIAADDEKGARIGVYDDAMNCRWVALIMRNDRPGPEPAAFTRYGKTYVPLRRWAEFLGATVTYDVGAEKILVTQN